MTTSAPLTNDCACFINVVSLREFSHNSLRDVVGLSEFNVVLSGFAIGFSLSRQSSNEDTSAGLELVSI